MNDPLRVLFVCTANICRSAYASVIAAQMLKEYPSVEVASAGTHGWMDAPMDAPMANEARGRGADPSRFRSRRLNAEMVRAADLVLTAERRQLDFVVDEWPGAFPRTVTVGQFVDILALAPALAPPALLSEVPRLRRPPRPSDDVPDPYGKGQGASAECAVRLDGLLTEIVRHLTVGALS